jgi:hypothetical protein
VRRRHVDYRAGELFAGGVGSLRGGLGPGGGSFRIADRAASARPIACPMTSGKPAMILSPKVEPSIAERVAALAISEAAPTATWLAMLPGEWLAPSPDSGLSLPPSA